MAIFLQVPKGQISVYIPRESPEIPTEGTLGTKSLTRSWIGKKKGKKNTMVDDQKIFTVVCECIEDVRRDGSIEISEGQKTNLLKLDPDRKDIFEGTYAHPGVPTPDVKLEPEPAPDPKPRSN